MFFLRDEFEPGPGIPLNAPEKTGSARFFEILQRECVPLFQLNILFWVSCIPLVTIPLAIYAMNTVVRRMMLDLSGRCTHYYWTAFRQCWRQAYGAFFVTVLPLGIAGFGAVFYLRNASEQPLLLAPFAVCSTVFLAAMLSSTYLYGLLSSGRPLREALRPALILGFAKPLRAVLAALCSYGAVVIAVLAFPLSGGYLLLIGFSLPCLLANFFIRTVLKEAGDF